MNLLQEKADVAIITVSANKLDEACLQSVSRLLSRTTLRVKFIVVDNASSQFEADAYVKMYVPDAIVILRDRNYGFGDSCNRGAQEVDAPYYFFLNPDTRLDDPLILDTLYAFLKRYPWAGIVAPQILYMDGRVQETCRRFPAWYTPWIQRTSLFIEEKKSAAHRRLFLMEDFSHRKRRLVDWVQGSAFMIDGKLFHDLHGFDKRYFMYYEDVDLCRQCWEAGRPVYYLPEAVIYHAYAKDSAKGDILFQLLHNRQTRAHIMSWIQYSWKWRFRL